MQATTIESAPRSATTAEPRSSQTLQPSWGAVDPRVTRFQAALARARDASDNEMSAPPTTMAQLMQQLLLIQMVGLPAPSWMIEAFRAAGLEQLAATLERRNERITSAGDRARLHC